MQPKRGRQEKYCSDPRPCNPGERQEETGEGSGTAPRPPCHACGASGRHAPGLPTPHPAQSVTASRTARPHGPYGPRWRGCATLAAPGSGRVWRRPSGPHQTQPDRFAQDAPVWTPRPGGCPARGRMWLRKASPPPALSSPSRALAAPHPGRIWSSKADDLLLLFK